MNSDWKCPTRVKINNFLPPPPVTSKFNGWTWKAMGLIFSTTLSCVHHFKAMGEFKLELQSWNAQFGSKSAICCPLWPCNLMDDLEKQRSTSSRSCKALCIISKPSMNSGWSYRPGRTDLGQNRRLFLSSVTMRFNGWPWKTIGHLFYTMLSFVHHLKSTNEFKLESQSGNWQFGPK